MGFIVQTLLSVEGILLLYLSFQLLLLVQVQVEPIVETSLASLAKLKAMTFVAIILLIV